MRALPHLACVLLVAVLSACVGTSDPPHPIPEDPNPLAYTTKDFPYTVHFSSAAQAPSAEEIRRLQDFLNSASARPEDKVTISSDNSPLGKARAARIRGILAHAGLDTLDGIDLNVSNNSVSLLLTETVVVPPTCGEWPIFAGDAPSNAPSLYLGCALRNNLYQQVIDKRDLAVGRTPGPPDAEPSMRAVQKYREGTQDEKKGSGGDNGDSAPGAAAASGAAAMGSSVPGTNGSSNGQ